MSKLGKVLFLLAGLSILAFAVVRFLLGAWVPFLWVALGLCVLFIVSAIVLDRQFYKEFLSMRTTREGMSMGSLIAMMVVGLVAINILGLKYYKTIDLSLGKVNSLSEQSIKILDSLDSELNVYYFYKNGTEGIEQNRRAFTDLIKQYKDRSNKIKLEFIEINERPDLAEQFEVKQATQVVWLEYKGKKSRVEKIEEQEITSGLVKVTRDKEKKIYFLSGHGELDFEPKQDGSSIAFLRKLLESNRFLVRNFNFLTTAAIPADADMVFVANPVQGLLAPETKALEDYLRRGGNLVLSIEPKTKTGLDVILKNIGAKLADNYIASVIETPVGKGIDPRFARGSEFNRNNPIVKPFGKDQVTLFRLPSALESFEPKPDGITREDFIKTNGSVMGFADTKFDREGKAGPFVLASAFKGIYPVGPGGKTEEAKEFNLILIGDSDWMNDQYLYQALNRDLALNMTAYLSKEDNLISITPKEVGTTQMVLTPTAFTLLIFGFVIPLPVLIFVGSGVLWYRRRYS
jgi:ABC-type uncharacterized transport system involved in gliding motility auxiliary subunit